MVSGWLSTLKAEERLLLHLHTNPLPERSWDVESTLTQAGISKSAQIQRKHVPRTLKSAISKGLVEDTSRHVSGSRQRRKVYFLTQQGQALAEKLLSRIKPMAVEVEGEQVEFENLLDGKKPLHVLAHIDEKCKWHSEPVSQTKDEGEIIQSEKIVNTVIEEIWKDGEISKDEKGIISALSEIIEFPSGELEKIEQQGKNNFSESHTIYVDAVRVALADGKITKDEEDILESLRKTLNISDEEHQSVLEIERAKLN